MIVNDGFGRKFNAGIPVVNSGYGLYLIEEEEVEEPRVEEPRGTRSEDVGGYNAPQFPPISVPSEVRYLTMGGESRVIIVPRESRIDEARSEKGDNDE